MKLKSRTDWMTRTGRKRRIRLYKAWRNLNDRMAGHNHAGNGARPWKGLPVHFKDFSDFRAWALTAGYSKNLCSLDRIDSDGPYAPGNCQWVTRAYNTVLQNRARYASHGAPGPDVPF